MNITIPVNEYKTPEIREDRIVKVVNGILETNVSRFIVAPGGCHHYYWNTKLYFLLNDLSANEVREIARVFLAAKYHVYRTSENGMAQPIIISKFSSEDYNIYYYMDSVIEITDASELRW